MEPTGICLIEQTAIAGTSHVDDIREKAHGLERGAQLAFEHDLRNPFDPWAHNEVVARLLDGGKRVVGRLRRVEDVESWTRIEMGVYLYD